MLKLAILLTTLFVAFTTAVFDLGECIVRSEDYRYTYDFSPLRARFFFPCLFSSSTQRINV